MTEPSAVVSPVEWIPVDVADVRRSHAGEPRLDFFAVVLREQDGGRRIPIYVGEAEATALAFNLETVETPRPMTYAMAAQLVAATGGSVLDVRITQLAEHVVYALVRVASPTREVAVDARPSDALNLALVTGAPVLVDAGVFGALGSCALHDWERFPDGAPDLVAESQDRQSKVMALAGDALRHQEQEHDGSGDQPA